MQMKRTTPYLALATIVFAGLGADAQVQQAVVIQGGTLIDGTGRAPVANSVIIIQGNRIQAVGRAGQVRVPAGAQVINAQGKWITPGLIDAKANWNWPYAEAFLHWGVTSAMVSGARNDTGIAERDAINNGIFKGPRLFETFVGLRGAGADGRRADNYVPGSGNKVVKNAEESVQWVKNALEAGADFITFGDGDGPVDVWKPAIDEVNKSGKAVVFRAMGPQTRAREVAMMTTGAVLVHTGNVGTQIAKDPAKWATYIGLPPEAYSDMDDAKADEMIRYLVSRNIYLEPDLMATARGFHKNWARVQQETRDVFNDPNLRAYYPDYSMHDVWENVKSPELWLTPERLAVRAAGFKNHTRFLKKYVDAGGKIVTASDITQTGPGIGVHQEMTAFVEDVGLTPMQALQATTKWVAEGFKMPDLGSIEPGKLADIVIVNADPLVDILNMRKIDTVMKDGKVVDRAYDRNFKGNMFNNNETPVDFGFNVVAYTDWADALKRATWRPNVGAARGEPGLPGAIPDPELSPTAGIESIMPYVLTRGTGDTALTIKGYNFIKKSQVVIDGEAVPTTVVSRTELRAQVPARLLANAGKLHIVVRHPKPLDGPQWGETSNPAFLLVPFEFTTKFSRNRF